MSINFVHKNIKMPGALKAFAEKHLADIEKIAGEIIDADVIINEEKLQFKVEISLKTRLDSFYAQDRNKILKQALRNTLTTLRNQAKRSKEKIKEGKKRDGAKGISMATVGLATGARSARSGRQVRRGRAEAGEAAGPESGILLSDNYSRKPITVEEAVFFLSDSQEGGFMFINAETNRMAGVFRNPQGGISLIEPNL
ncbi:MAG: HPF/RaiA family ribosome-associated protein [Acidobacteriota bacterium]|jgi:putative sigma-54 modulation protein|nr:HPF/RaiA family ribosome-associated protein [Acidobacteriota bacterium]